MCGRKNKEEISKFSARDGENNAKYEEELEQFVLAVDSLLGKAKTYFFKNQWFV
jgi:hypothetical protein